MKRKTKQTLKTILLGALGIGAIVGVASGVNTLVGKDDTDLKTIHPTFEVGGLRTEDGKYEKSDKTLYTKNAFECQGLQIKLAFDNYIDYQVFFYENDGDFLSASEVISGNEEIEVPLLATHARLELTPNWSEMGEEYEDEKDQIIKWYEVTTYSSQMEVKVNKEQEWKLPNLMTNAEQKVGYSYIYDSSTSSFTESANQISHYAKVNVSGFTSVDVVYKNENTKALAYYFANSSGTLLSDKDIYATPKNVTSFTIEIPSGATYLIINSIVEDIPQILPTNN